MSKSLLEQLPGIVAAAKRQAAQILEQLEGPNRVTLQTRELVIPTKDTANADLFRQAGSEAAGGDIAAHGHHLNRLIYGDNLLAMAALLAGDEDTPSLRGKIDLIYIDPPFDSKADYRTKITKSTAGTDMSPGAVASVSILRSSPRTESSRTQCSAAGQRVEVHEASTDTRLVTVVHPHGLHAHYHNRSNLPFQSLWVVRTCYASSANIPYPHYLRWSSSGRRVQNAACGGHLQVP